MRGTNQKQKAQPLTKLGPWLGAKMLHHFSKPQTISIWKKEWKEKQNTCACLEQVVLIILSDSKHGYCTT